MSLPRVLLPARFVSRGSAKCGLRRRAACFASAELAQLASDSSAIGLTVGSVGAIGGLAFLLVTTDPGRRREQQAAAAGGDEMDSVRQYFNTTGFERWNKIYGTTSVRGARLSHVVRR